VDRRKKAPRPLQRGPWGRHPVASPGRAAGYPTAAELTGAAGWAESLARSLRAAAGPVGALALMAACGAALGGCMPAVRPEATPMFGPAQGDVPPDEDAPHTAGSEAGADR